MSRNLLFTFALISSGFTAIVSPLSAQEARTSPVGRGFDFLVKPVASGEERQSQPDLWVFELQMKSLRMLEVDLTEPGTGRKKKELVYYLVYRAINREIDRRQDNPERTPVNEYDKEPIPDLFVPQITLVTSDNGKRTVVPDSILPEAQKAIQVREKMKLANSVEVVRRIPPVVSMDAPDSEAIYGVAIFRNVDPDTDYFTIFMSGFSNGYKLVKGPVTYADLEDAVRSGGIQPGNQIWNGALDSEWQAAAGVGNLFRPNASRPADADTAQWFYSVPAEHSDDTVTTWRKTLMQKYWRPGDRFDQNEAEIRQEGSPRWIYRPDDNAMPNNETTTAASRQVTSKALTTVE